MTYFDAVERVTLTVERGDAETVEIVRASKHRMPSSVHSVCARGQSRWPRCRRTHGTSWPRRWSRSVITSLLAPAHTW